MALKSKSEKSGKRSSGFKYQPRSSDDVRKRAEQQGGKFDSVIKSGFDTWRPSDGENVIRILPPTWDNHDHYGYDIHVHAYVGPDKSTYLCPQKMLNKPCPICKKAREAQQAGEEEDAKSLQPTRRVAVWVLDRDSDRPTPALWTMSWSMDRDIAALCQNKRTGKVLLIDHPHQGYDIMFNRTGKGLNTRYVGLAVDREETPALEDEDDLEKALEYIQEHPIPEVLNFYDTDYLANMIEGTGETPDEDLEEEDEDDRGSRAAKRERDRKGDRRPTGRDKDVEEEEEDDDDDRGRGRKTSKRGGEDEEEEEDRPARSARGSSRRAQPEEEEVEDEDDATSEDEDEDEEEEEDRPVRGTRSTSRRAEPEDEDEDEEEEEDRPSRGRDRDRSERSKRPTSRR